MKMLFCEFLYPKTHTRSNRFYIDCLNQVVDELHVMEPLNFYGKLEKNIKIHIIKDLQSKEGKLSFRFNAIRYICRAIRIVKKNQIDTIIVASCDYITFLMFYLFCSKKKICLIHHAEIDALETNVVKRVLFSLYKNKIIHIVFEDFIKEYLNNSFLVPKSQIIVMPHSLNENNCIDKSCMEYKMVGLSSSNDEKIIQKIVQFEINTNYFKNKKSKIILKSKKIEFDDGYLKVTKEYLSNIDYNTYISSAEYILIPFSSDFKYRESGTLMDALSNNKKVIASDIMLIREYKKKYPDICFVYYSLEDIITILSVDDKSKLIEKTEFEKFRSLHSKKKLVSLFEAIF